MKTLDMESRVLKSGSIIRALSEQRAQAIAKFNAETPRNLGRNSPFHFSQTQRVLLFNAANIAWEDQFNGTFTWQFEQELKNLPEDQALSSSMYEHLKLARGYARLNRSAWKLFEASHEPTNTHYNITKKLGNILESSNNEVKVNSESLLGAIATFRTSGFVVARQCDNVSYHAYLSDTTDKMVSLLQQQKLTPKSFHSLRKKIGMFVDLYRLASVIFPNQDYTDTYYYLFTINKVMGKYHDSMIGMKKQGKLDYETDTVELQYEIREAINIFINELLVGLNFKSSDLFKPTKEVYTESV